MCMCYQEHFADLKFIVCIEFTARDPVHSRRCGYNDQSYIWLRMLVLEMHFMDVLNDSMGQRPQYT